MFRRESAGATVGQVNILSELVVVVFQTASVGSLHRRGGTEQQENEVSTVEEANERRRTRGGKLAGWRQLGVRRSTAVVLINNSV